jgi:hypothetical protein
MSSGDLIEEGMIPMLYAFGSIMATIAVLIFSNSGVG